MRGKLIKHSPIAGWLRTTCIYIKRHAEGKKWDDEVRVKTTAVMKEVLEEVEKEDPVRGR